MGDDLRQKVSNMYKIEKTTKGAYQFVVTQDRNHIYPLCLDNLHSEVKEQDGTFIGINLLMDLMGVSILLGTFETIAEVITEINNLWNTDLEVYPVTTYFTTPTPTN